MVVFLSILYIILTGSLNVIRSIIIKVEAGVYRNRRNWSTTADHPPATNPPVLVRTLGRANLIKHANLGRANLRRGTAALQSAEIRDLRG